MDTQAAQLPIVNQFDWTPIDASGAGLALTPNIQATVIRMGPLAFFALDVTYPMTADALEARLGGIPFNEATGIGGATVIADTGAVINGYPIDGSQIQFLDGDRVPLTNADLSEITLTISGWIGIQGQVADNTP